MRLDRYIVEKGLVETRSKAVHLIKTGKVLVNGNAVFKQSTNIRITDEVSLLSNFTYASRGGYKLESFVRRYGIVCKGMNVLDVGCSTGGFSDFFLKNGASKVVAIDIADDIIDPNLLKDPRLTFHRNIDVRDPDQLRYVLNDQRFHIISIDISNTAIQEFINYLTPFCFSGNGFFIALFKPQYQGAKGVVPMERVESLTGDFEKWLQNNGFHVVNKDYSPIRGGSKGKGNIEVFYQLKMMNKSRNTRTLREKGGWKEGRKEREKNREKEVGRWGRRGKREENEEQ